jgi:low temperature requirement protein LtrA
VASPGPDEVGVSTVELFFDLVFVFTITQLTTLVVTEPTGAGLARAALIFGNLWWMYGGYAWLTNTVPPRAAGVRLSILTGMAGFLVAALAIPHAFGHSGVAFGAGYLVVTSVHTGLFLRSSKDSVVRSMFKLGPYNLVTAILLLVAGYNDGVVRWGLWTAAFLLHWTTPFISEVGGFRLRAGHFVERHGLIVLIALGESVVAVGIGGPRRPLTAGFVLTAVLGLALAAALWWLFFDGEDERARQALEAAPAARNPWLALAAFGYAFLPLLGGIIVLAAGVKGAVLDYNHPATAATAWFLAAGVAAYVASLVGVRFILRTGPLLPRLVASVGALVTVVVGLEVSPVAQLAALTVVLLAGIAYEALVSRSGARSDDRSALQD